MPEVAAGEAALLNVNRDFVAGAEAAAGVDVDPPPPAAAASFSMVALMRSTKDMLLRSGGSRACSEVSIAFKADTMPLVVEARLLCSTGGSGCHAAASKSFSSKSFVLFRGGLLEYLLVGASGLMDDPGPMRAGTSGPYTG
jgi:hypothetical protein